MFCGLCRRRKKKFGDDVDVGDQKSSSTQKSDKDPKQQSVVLGTQCATTVSTTNEAPEEKNKKVSWWRRLFCRKKKTKKSPVKADVEGPSSSATEKIEIINKASEVGEADVQDPFSTPDTPVAASPELQLRHKDETPFTEENKENNKDLKVGEAEIQEVSSTTDSPAADDTNQPSERSETTDEESEVGEADVKEASSTLDNAAVFSSELQPEHKDVGDDTIQPSSATKIVIQIKESECGKVDLQEDSSTSDSPVTPAPEQQPENKDVEEVIIQPSSATEKSKDNDKETEVQDASFNPDTPVELHHEHKDVADDTNQPSSTSENSIGPIEQSDGEADLQGASFTSYSPVTAAPELQPENKDVTDDTNQPSTASENSPAKESEGEETEDSSIPDIPVTSASELHPEEIEADVTTQTCSVAEKSTIEESECGEAGVQEPASTSDTPVAVSAELQPENEDEEEEGTKRSPETAEVVSEDNLTEAKPNSTSNTNDAVNNNKEVITKVAAKTDVFVPCPYMPSGLGGKIKAKPIRTDLWTQISGHVTKSSGKGILSRADLDCLGLPNLAQTCYMNSTLQALLTLSTFVQEVITQEKMWSSHAILRGFGEIGICRFSNSKAEKIYVLEAFKQTVAEFNSEFGDHHQKDAHEFLNCVLDVMKTTSLDLQRAALDMGVEYTCPVNAHISFQMLSTRTCNGCGIQSMTEEDYINLSLDLLPRGSVRQCLEEYLKEKKLSYHCECGAKTSSQQFSFFTLPNVLILQLKRFRFTTTFSLRKVQSPVCLSRELVVKDSSSIKQARYSLVSVISHLGTCAHSGHYICDGVYKDEHGDMTDLWLTYDDMYVSKKTGARVCHQRQKTAYLLFYEKQH